MRATLRENPGITVALEYAPLQLREMGFRPEAQLQMIEDLGMRLWLLRHDGSVEVAERAQVEREAATEEYVNLLASAGPLG